MMKNGKNIKLKMKPISLLILVFFNSSAYASDNLDLSFIQGNNVNIPNVFKTASGNISGEYLVDVYFNKKKYGRRKLIINDNEKNGLCLKSDWLKSLELPIDYQKITKAVVVKNDCYDLSKIQGGQAVFDYTSQSVKISLPQIVLSKTLSNEQWDYGDSGFRLNYSLNGNKSFGTIENSGNLFGDFDFNANYNKWVFSARFNGTSNEGFTSPDLTLSKAVKSVKGDFIIGKSITQSSIIPDFSFYGVSLRSNALMESWKNRGYAPVINGVLNSNSLVTVKQGDYVLYSKNLPAGPYSLTDLSPISNGDLIVTVKDSNGHTSIKLYPVTTLPTLLRDGDFNYNFATGIRANSFESSDNFFGLASLDYGFGFGTTNIVSIIHPKYQSLGSGLSMPIGRFGAISASINYAISHFDSSAFQPNGNKTQEGISSVLQYAKDFNENTNIQLLTYRYTGKGYNDFSDFNPNYIHIDSEKKNRYEAIISQRLGNAYINASGWIQDYRNHKKSDSGLNLSLSTSVNDISIGISGSYNKSGTFGENYSTSLNINIPFDLLQKEQIINNSLTYDSSNGSSFNSGVSFVPANNITSTVNLNVGKNQKTASLYTGIRFDKVNTGFSIAQNDSLTSVSGSLSGSIIGANKIGILFANQQSDTFAIAHIDDMDNIRFNGSSPTDEQGNTLVPLSSYQLNNIAIDTNNISENIELLNTTYSVYPTSKAIIIKNYKYVTVDRYLLKILDKNKNPIPMGSQASSDLGTDVGVVANNGVLVATLLEKSEYLKVKTSSSSCRVDLSHIKKNNRKIEDVICY
ncbi:fimbria/pilus outer membrane usher protein [Photobacterium damselae]